MKKLITSLMVAALMAAPIGCGGGHHQMKRREGGQDGKQGQKNLHAGNLTAAYDIYRG